MIGQTTVVDKSTKAGAAITAFTIAKFGGDDETMVNEYIGFQQRTPSR